MTNTARAATFLIAGVAMAAPVAQAIFAPRLLRGYGLQCLTGSSAGRNTP